MENHKNSIKKNIGFLCLLVIVNLLIFFFAIKFNFKTIVLPYNIVVSVIIVLSSGYHSIKFIQKKEGNIYGDHLLKNNLLIFKKLFKKNCLFLTGPFVFLIVDCLSNICFEKIPSFVTFLLFSVVSLYFSSALGFFAGTLSSKFRVSFMLYISYLFFTQIYHFFTIIIGPSTYFYSSIFGFFQWSFFESDVVITTELLIARISTIFLASMFIVLALIRMNYSPYSSVKLKLHQFFRKKTLKKKYFLQLLFVILFLLNLIVFIFRCDLGLTTTHGFLRKKLGGKLITPHFVIYYKTNSIVSKNIKQVVKEHEFRYEQLNRIFNTRPNKKIESYVFSSSEEKEDLIGEKFIESANYFTMNIFTIFKFNQRSFRLSHELAHIFSVTDLTTIKKIKLLLQPGLLEGIAVAVDNSRLFSNDLTLHQKAKVFIKNSQSNSYIQFNKEFLLSNTHIYYVTNGSFIRFLIDTYGIKKFKEFFYSQDFSSTYATPIKSLVLNWLNFLNHKIEVPQYFLIDAGKNILLKKNKKKCIKIIKKNLSKGWQLTQKGLYNQAIEYFKTAHLQDSNNVLILYGLMKSLFYSKQYNESVKISDQIIKNPASNITSIATAKEYKAMSLWIQDQEDKAEEILKNLSKYQMPIDFIQRIQTKLLIITSNNSKFKQKMLVYFTIDDNSREEKIRYINNLSLEFSNSIIISYLKGKHLHESGEYKKSNEYLENSYFSGDKKNLINKSILRLIGTNFYFLEEYDSSIKYFSMIFNFKCTSGEKILINDYINKCKWEQKKMK